MRKLRTSQHVIEDLSFNFVEKQALLAGCSWQRYEQEENFDGFIRTWAENGEREEGRIEVFVKTADHVQPEKGTEDFLFDLPLKDLEAWLETRRLVLLVVYDAHRDAAFFIELGAYFRKNRDSLRQAGKFVRVSLSLGDALNPKAISILRKIKNGSHESS